MTADIAIAFSRDTGRGDWTIAGADIAQGPPIVSAVLLSLFTDARAPDDYNPGDGDRRGWWGDTYADRKDRPIGSLLWTYERAKKSGDTLGTTGLPVAIKRACEAALQWLLDDGVAALITVVTGWANPTTVSIQIVVTEPAGAVTPFNLSWAWDGI